MSHLQLPVITLLVATVAACSADPGTAENGASGTGGTSGLSAASDLPCDVQQLLATQCLSCHGDPPLEGVPTSLTTVAALRAASITDPPRTMAEEAVVRMQSTGSPMPPTGPAPVADVAVLEQWIQSGYAGPACASADVTSDPFAGATICTSGSTYRSREEGSALMNPGQACIACHSTEREGPRFAIAGTAYPTGHEPDNCNGSSTRVDVVITDANGTIYTLTSNAAGNFFLPSTPGIALPYTAVVAQGEATRVMSAPQTNGDCNTCHTEAGANGAPGRIVAP